MVQISARIPTNLIKVGVISLVPPARFRDTTSILAATASFHIICSSSLSAYRDRTSGGMAEEEGEENVLLSTPSRRFSPALGPIGLLPSRYRRLPGAEVDHSLSSNADVRNGVAIAPLLRHLHGVLLI